MEIAWKKNENAFIEPTLVPCTMAHTHKYNILAGHAISVSLAHYTGNAFDTTKKEMEQNRQNRKS